MADQIDIFGETQAPAPEPAGYLARDAGVQQATAVRLFEPQMEGQLALEAERPAEAGRPDATTTEENTSDGRCQQASVQNR